jgi:LuxR family maltose regulon positive regulatory protein
MRSVIEIRALQALARAADDDEDGAVAAVADALTIACPQRYVRVFVDEGPPMARLLSRLLAAQRAGRAAARVSLRYLSQLTKGFDAGSDAATPGRNTAVPGLVEALTGRELQVLGLLAAGRSNQAIADDLMVTLDTVKKHVSHILTKLGGTNRTEAVVRARTLGLIR